MIRNALIRRYAVSALRPQYLGVTVGIYVLGMAMIGMLNGLALLNGVAYHHSLTECLRGVYGQLLAIQFLLLWVWGGYGAASALREEMLRKSYDFFQLLPLNSWAKWVGVAVGRNLSALALAAVTTAAHVVVGVAGEVPWGLQAQIAWVTLSGTALIWSLGILTSIRPVRKSWQKSVGVLGLILLAFFGVPMLAYLILEVDAVHEMHDWKVSFFGVPLAGLLLIGSVAAYAAVWSAVGAKRKLSRSTVTMFTPAGAFGFLAGCLVIVFGLFWQELSAPSTDAWFVCAAVTHALTILIPFGLMRSYEQYMEWTYDLARRPGNGKRLERAILAGSNPAAWIQLYGVWALFVAGVAATVSFDAMRWALALIGGVFFPWAVLMLLVEIAIIGSPRNEKMKFFAGFLALLYLQVPPILSWALDKEEWSAFSYFGVWDAVLKGQGFRLPAPLLLNALAAILLAVIVRRRYAAIAAARRSMPTAKGAGPLPAKERSGGQAG